MSRAEEFKGTIGRTVAESEPWYDEPPHPGPDAPNVVIVLLDDIGFAQFGCYGSTIDTPNVDALAADGVQFTNFHVTPLCSPTRASLLTGRDSHAVGMRGISNWRTGFPSMLGHISYRAATIAELLHDNGYATFCAGKWHLAPMEQCSAAGPFDHWPLARGFDRFYGFMDGSTDQFHPDLFADNHPIEPPAGPEDGYHLSEDLVDQALGMIADSKGVRPDRPFFCYLPFGATHSPHQAPEEYLLKYRGAFDEGWDVMRERWYRRQLELGVVPDGTELAPRNPGVEPWDDLSDDAQRLACRLQEAFAAFLDHTDAQIGRLVDGLRRLGQLDNTLLMVLSDNGASQEGGPHGVLHSMKFFNMIFDTPEESISRIDEIGGPDGHTNYPWGWAQCGNAPFKWYKQNTHEGGVHVPLVVHWPDGITEDQRGTRRDQFTFVADIAPTIYELLGVEVPDVRHDVEQIPVTGDSFASILTDPETPATNTLQVFEQNGHRAIVADGWKAVTRHKRGANYDNEQWELYDLRADLSECNDLAEAEPDKEAELNDLWWHEAERHGILPLDDRTIELFGAQWRDNSPHPADRRYVYRPPMKPLAAQSAAPLGGRGFDLTARVAIADGDEGVLYATGNQNSGLSLFAEGGRLVFDYNAFGDHTVVETVDDLPVGEVDLMVRVRRIGRGGSVTLLVDENAAETADIPLLMDMISTVGASVGYDHGKAVSDRYEAPFHFTGTLHEVVIVADTDRSGDATAATARAELHRQ